MRILLDPEVMKLTIIELDKSMSAISLPTSKLTLKKLYESVLSLKSIDYSDSSATIICTLLQKLYLQINVSNDLQNLLISILTKCRNTKQYETLNISKTNTRGKYSLKKKQRKIQTLLVQS